MLVFIYWKNVVRHVRQDELVLIQLLHGEMHGRHSYIKVKFIVILVKKVVDGQAATH